MRIGELATRSGLSTKAIRFYEEQGLLQRADRTAAGYRIYGEDALDRLAFVRSGQAIDLTLGEIREIIAFRDRGEAPCAHVTSLLEHKAAEVEGRITELIRLRATLETLRDRARRLGPEDCPPLTVCHLITPSSPRT